MTSRALPREALVGARPVRSWRERAWPWLRRGLALAFLVLVGFMLFEYGRQVAWGDVWRSLRQLPASALAGAVGLAAASHLLYSCFDLLGRRYSGHTLSTPVVMEVNFISYAFNLSIGSLIGGVGFRYRLYSRLGLPVGVITRVVSLSMLTNWLGYMLLAGCLLVAHPLVLPPDWGLDGQGLPWAGAGLVALAVSYVVACARSGGAVWNLRGHALCLPSWRMAVAQLAISCINWGLMAAVIHLLLSRQVAYADVLTVLLAAAVAGVALHVPAGLGVFEAVFIALLGHQVPVEQLLAALLGYRAIYYLAPLVLALGLYLAMEWRTRRRPGLKPE